MLSVVIATSESERPLVSTLAALVSGAAAGMVREVIVADGRSRDETVAVADVAGCHVIVSDATVGARLKAAAATARSPWLMFLRPGVVPDANWTAETARFLESAGRRDRPDGHAAVFRPAAPAGSARPALVEALALLRAALGGRPRPEQGLIIARRLYDDIGGHEDGEDAEPALLQRLGRRRIVMLRCGAIDVRDNRFI